jgi:hypothetical protein
MTFPYFLMRSTGLMVSLLLIASCSGGGAEAPSGSGSSSPAGESQAETGAAEVAFNADSAYAYVARQVSFGPRVPGTEAHRACGDWMLRRLGGWADVVEEQTGTVQNWDGQELPMRNIIARFNPGAAKRIMLSAHWDTRPVADEDDERQDEPIPGANDGGSGVGVLMEIARQLADAPVPFGVDMVFFDVEDGGSSDVPDSYCLGSQEWARRAKAEGYQAEYGILLDMVGARGAYFYREGISMHFAPSVVAKVWTAAAEQGKRSWFVFNEAPYPPLTDDHLYVNRIAGIPTIDIIQYDPDNARGFGDFWHTHNDDMAIIDPRTLGAVGETLMAVLRAED